MANEEHVRILKSGVEAWNQWSRENPDVRPDLREANLSGFSLIGWDLSEANLTGAYLGRANLGAADLNGAHLSGAYLVDAYLIGADFSDADLRGAYLSGADLIGAKFHGADLRGAELPRIKNWKDVHDLTLANIHGVTSPPDGFIEFAKSKGAVEIEDHEKWQKLIEQKADFTG